MKIREGIFTVGLATLMAFASCGGNSSNNSNSKDGALTLANFTNNKEAEKQQLFLRLTDESETDSSKVYVAKSIYDKDTVGLKIEVLKNIVPGIDGQGRPVEAGFAKGSIKFISLGAESDGLVKALGDMFKLTSGGKMSADPVVPTVFSSNAVGVDLAKTATYSFKLFFEKEPGEAAEVFAILDLYKKSFEFSEKDPDYRILWLQAFEGK